MQQTHYVYLIRTAIIVQYWKLIVVSMLVFGAHVIVFTENTHVT